MFALSVDNVLEYEDNREIVAGVDREVFTGKMSVPARLSEKHRAEQYTDWKWVWEFYILVLLAELG